ncbi:Fic family protein [Corynebacterium mastitidis]|uniref:type II toxin-antitoxin system death-on-curing family toxin n=1 Tax=Corynebacterium mastitidis TaxID=161890 RepID=UPI0009FFDD9D
MTPRYALHPRAVIDFNTQFNGPHCLLDKGKLEGALSRPLTVAFGEELFPTDYHRAAALLESLCLAHAFIDANKRTAWWACVTYLDGHGIHLAANPIEAGKIVIDVVQHDRDIDNIAHWLLKHTTQ